MGIAAIWVEIFKLQTLNETLPKHDLNFNTLHHGK